MSVFNFLPLHAAGAYRSLSVSFAAIGQNRPAGASFTLDCVEPELELVQIGDSTTPDKVVHLAAGLQFAGVKSVIGTLWKVNDSTVQRLVKAFYKNFCGDGTMNLKRAAQALRRAVQSLACNKDMPLDQRIVFMHIGI
ncbi:hypothetical protein F4604DRAFT_1681253 [Suillus subluteus]|nr:hypothetical protein F4604DRAFT_1681253 [Suillus subluteus]